MIQDYSLVRCILSPNPIIMAHAIENKSLLHDNAAKRLITKLIIDRTKVGDNWRQERAKLIDTFLWSMGILLTRGEALCENILCGYLYDGDLVFVSLKGIYGF